MSRQIALPTFLASARTARLPAAAPLVSAGRFDRSAIMIEAVKLARSVNRSFGCWQVRMSIALRTVWGRAKAAMAEACAAEPFPVREPSAPQPVRKPHRADFARSKVFVRGSRSHSHGW